MWLLASRAQELSLDSTVDSPFALLAKDNDILWGGGRPDDITVIVSRVVDTRVSEKPPAFAAVAGPGPPPEMPKASSARGATPGAEVVIGDGFSDEAFP